MAHVARRVLWVLCLVFPLMAVSMPRSLAQPAEGQLDNGAFVYHQITNFEESESGSVGLPVFSADGETAVFVDAPGTGDPATPNRIFTIGADGSGLTEVDPYQTFCFCRSKVDISADGVTVVSTEGFQVRIADGRDLRQVAGADGVAEALGITFEETGCFHADGRPLDVANDGGQVVFGVFGGGAEHVLAVDGDGENLRVLRESARYVMRVAISGDGATVASRESSPWERIPGSWIRCS